METRYRFGAMLLATLLTASAPFPQEKRSKEKEKEFPPPAAATLPAEALKFGASVQEASPEAVKKWAESWAKGEMRAKPMDPQGTMRAVDERFAQAPELARDALTFLVFYSAYRDEDENYRTLGYRIRDIDRETKEITRELQVIWKNDQNRSASPMQSQGAESRVEQDEYIRKQEALLRDYADERQHKSTQMEASRKKVNAYLKLLDVAHKRMRDADPALVRSVR